MSAAEHSERAPLLPPPAPIADPEGSSEAGQDQDGRRASSSAPTKAAPNVYLIFPAISIGIFLSAADGTIALVSYATISSELDALNLASWIMTAYALSTASIQPLYGKLCDIFGRKQCLLGAYTLFALGCLACGCARSMKQLIAARVLQAVGGAGLGTVVSILLTGLVPVEDRGLWQAVVSAVYSLGAGLGAPLGGLLTASVGWRWAFFGQVPLCLVAIAVVSLFLDGDIGRPDDDDDDAAAGNRSTEGLVAKLKRVDVLGAASLIVMIAALMLGLDRGSNLSWASPQSYVSFAVSAGAALWFFFVETRIAREPVLPLQTTFSAELLPVYASGFFYFFAILAMDFTLPLYYQVKDRLGPQQASLYMLPAIVGGVVSSTVTGVWMRHGGQYYWAIVLVSVLQISGGVLAFLFSGAVAESTPALVVAQVVAECGIGNAVVSGLIALISNGPSSNVAVMTAMYFAFRNLGAVLGISVVSTVIQQVLRDTLAVELRRYGDLDVDQIVADVRRSIESLGDLDPAVAAIVRRCYGQAMNKGFLLILAASVAAAIPALWVRGGKKRRSPGE